MPWASSSAAFRLRSEVLRYPETAARGEVDEGHGRAAAGIAGRVFLQCTTEPDVLRAQLVGDAGEEFVDWKAGLVDNGREPDAARHLIAPANNFPRQRHGSLALARGPCLEFSQVAVFGALLCIDYKINVYDGRIL